MRHCAELLLLALTACGAVGPGAGDAGTETADVDKDGFSDDVDCDDFDPEIHPEADELCDSIDNNCDGSVDEGVTRGWVPDADEDGFGDGTAEPIQACDRPEGHVPEEAAGDCDDSSALTFPGADEYCDGVDNDCDGLPDPTACRPLDTADVRVLGAAEGDRAGYAVAGLGDIDGDGLDDVAIGAPYADHGGSESGSVYFFTGAVVADSVTQADGRFDGDDIGDYAGYAVSGLGDVDGDGLDDVGVGAWGDPTRGNGAGAVHVLGGDLSGSTSPTDAMLTLYGEVEGDSAGLALAAAGDVNGDGNGDILVGAPNADFGALTAGAAYLVHGGVTGTMLLADAPARLLGGAESDYGGQSVTGPGDVDGDGFDDIVIGAPGEDSAGDSAGALYLFHGPVSGAHQLAAADAFVLGEEGGYYAGSAVSAMGDLNGDGFADIIVGSPDQSAGGEGAGAAYLVLGPLSGTTSLADAHARIIGRLPWDHAGNAVASAGDANGDGVVDMLVGAYIEDSGGLNAGAAFMVHGPVTGTRYLTDAQAGFIGEAEADLAGWSVDGAGDVDGDGLDDLLIGAPQHDSAAADAGVTYLLYASTL